MQDQPARAKLDRETIVEAALALLEEVGLDGLSTRALAASLGVKGPSLYWHFQNMGELRDLMADAMLLAAQPAPEDPAAPRDWQSWLADGARSIRKAALSHRDGARVIAGARPSAQRSLRRPANLARLEAEGFSAEDARSAFVTLSRFALGSALGEQAARAPISEADFEFGLRAMLDGLAARAAR